MTTEKKTLAISRATYDKMIKHPDFNLRVYLAFRRRWRLHGVVIEGPASNVHKFEQFIQTVG